MSAISWKGKTPLSKEFDDIYFSIEDGLCETQYVFLQGNNLPERFNSQDDFTIIETGFGTGLNFFATWQLWEKSENRPKNLNFISIEKHPLTKEEIKQVISNWPQFNQYVEEFCELYSKDNFLSIKLAEGKISLTIYFEDIKTALAKINTKADAWFLDGFAPSKNPDMWQDDLFFNMSRLSHNKTSFATFTAAGFVKRALIENGFDVQKITGFGRKKEMLIGRKI